MKEIFEKITLGALTKNPAQGFFVDFGNNSPGNVIGNIIVILLGIASSIALLLIIVGGFQYMMAGVSEEQSKIAKKRITNAVIGLIIIALSYTIITVVMRELQTP